MRRLIPFLLGLVLLAWIAFTLYSIGRYGGAVLTDLDTTSRIMAVRNGDEIHSAVGLTYHGLVGALLLVAEILLVLGALVLGMFQRGWRRLLGVVILIGWTALWLGNAIWLQSLGWDRPTDVGLLGAAMLIVLVWAGVRSAPGKDKSIEKSR